MNQNEKSGAALNTAEEIENLKGVVENLLSVIEVLRQRVDLGDDEIYVENCLREAGDVIYGDEE